MASVSNIHMTFTRRRMYKYSSKDLRVFRFSFAIDNCVLDRLNNMNLLRSKIIRRGTRAGKSRRSRLLNVFSVDRHVGRVDSVITRYSNNRDRHRGVNAGNLISISNRVNKYLYPKIIFNNCRSIRNKFDETCLTMSHYDPDVAIFVETWLCEGDLNAYEIEGYRAIHRIRGRSDKNHGGGVSVYMKNCISIISVYLPERTEIESITVLFRTSNMQRNIPFIALIAIYSSPCNIFSDMYIDYIMTEIDRIKSINIDASIILIGDFNDLDIDKELRDPIFTQIIKQRTCNNNLVDKCFYNGKINFCVTTTPPIASSDHKLVILTPENYVKSIDKCAFTYSRPRKNSSFRSMWSALSDIQWEQIVENCDFDAAVESFHSQVTTCYDKCFPLVYSKIKINNKSWYNNKIDNTIKKRNLHFIKNEIEQYNASNKEVKDLIRLAKHDEYIKFAKKMENREMNFYDVVNKYTNTNKVSRDIVFPGMDLASSIESTISFYSEILNKHSPIDLDSLPAYLPGLPIRPISDSFVYSQLKKIKNNGSAAPDGIPNFILREYAFELSPPITKLLNRSLAMGYCPNLWKKNYLITIPKKKVVSSPSDLRPIVLSSAMVKILEKYISNVLLSTLIDKMDKRQFGGLPGRSAEHYLTFYLDYVHKNLDIPGNRVTAIVTDYSKAFDAVDHNLFMFKLLSMGAPPSICCWISSFIHNRMLILKWNNSPTNNVIHCSNGAPQGSVLGGLIFSITVNDIALGWSSRLKYVDDLTVLCAQPDKDDASIPQNIVESLKEDSCDTKMSLNIDKCQFMVHCFSKKPMTFELNLGSESLTRVSQCKIIGVIIQENLKWDLQIEAIIKNVNKKMYLLYKLKNVGMCSSLLIKAYFTYIRPCMEFCCVIWTTSITKAQILELERVQKRVVRLILGMSYISYEDALDRLGIESMEARRAHLFKKYSTKFLSSYPENRPDTRLAMSGRDTRAAAKLCAPKCRTRRYKTSPLPMIIESINSLN